MEYRVFIRYKVRYNGRAHKREKTDRIVAPNIVRAISDLHGQVQKLPHCEQILEVHATLIEKPRVKQEP